MPRNVARPYRTAEEPGLVRGSHAVVMEGGDPIIDPREVAGWNPSLAIDFRMTVGVDTARLTEQLGIPVDCLRVGLVWDCPATQLRSAAEPASVSEPEVQLKATIPGQWLAEAVGFTAVAFLAESPVAPADALAPSVPGSIVWESERIEVLLEGIERQFPMVPVSFSENGPLNADKALWLLLGERSDLFDTAAGALIVQINIDTELGHAAINAPDSPEGQRGAAAIKGGVARQLIEYAMEDEEFSLDEVYPADALGATLQALVRRLGDDLEELQLLKRDRKPEFDARIQSVFGV